MSRKDLRQMSNIVLINPKISENDYINFSNLRIPLGLLKIAAPLVKEHYKVKIIDQRIEKNWKSLLCKELKKNPVCVGISCMSGPQINFALDISKYIKSISEIPVYWGGVHPTLEPISTVQNKYIDGVVTGEADYTFLNLVKALKLKTSLKEVKGILYKSGNLNIKIHENEKASFVDLNSLPQIPFHLINHNQYLQNINFFGLNNKLIIPVETSRGCTHHCAFCFQSIKQNMWHSQSVDRTISDLLFLKKKFGNFSVCFVDDNFFAVPNRVIQIADKIISNNIDVDWYATIRPECITNKIDFVKLKKSGLKSLTIGIESGSSRILSIINKGACVDDFYNGNKILSKINIKALYCAIHGFPGESISDLKKTYKLVLKIFNTNKNARIDLMKLIPTPATKIFDLCLENGMKKPDSLVDWADIIDQHYKTKAPWVDKGVDAWVRRHNLFFKLINFHNNGRHFALKILNLYSKMFFD